MNNISTEELFELIEPYLFIFSSKDKAIKVLFSNDIDSFKKLDKEEIEKKISINLYTYLKDELNKGKLPKIIKHYIDKNNIKYLKRSDLNFLDNIVLNCEYELSFEDVDKIYDIKLIQQYLKTSSKITGIIINEIKAYTEDIEIDDNFDANQKNGKYLSEDNYDIYRNDTSKYRLLSIEEEKYYLKKYQEEDDRDAFDMLVLCNQGLVRKIANYYKNRGLDYLDLIQEGNIGLMTAIRKYKFDKKTKLSTYAMWWISQSIRRALCDIANTIRIPVNIKQEQDKLNKIEAAFENEYGRDATIEELVELTCFTKDKIVDLKKHKINLVSFNKPVNNKEESGDSELGDFIQSDIESPDFETIRQEDHTILEKALQKLGQDSREKQAERMEQVVRIRIGGEEFYNEKTKELIKNAKLEKKDQYTLDEVGKIFGITRERIRQIEEKGKMKLDRMLTSYKHELIKTK